MATNNDYLNDMAGEERNSGKTNNQLLEKISAGGSAGLSPAQQAKLDSIDTKADLVNGRVPESQLPSYIDNVQEFVNVASFPTTGSSNVIYVATETNAAYRWGGSQYVQLSSGLTLGTTEATAFPGSRGIALEAASATKVDKSSGSGVAYTTSESGAQTTTRVEADSPSAATIVKRNSAGQILTATPTANAHAATKSYVDAAISAIPPSTGGGAEGKLDIPTGNNVIPGTNSEGSLALLNYTQDRTALTIAQRDGGGRINVSNPSDEFHAANKGYVDRVSARLLGQHTLDSNQNGISVASVGSFFESDLIRFEAFIPGITSAGAVLLRLNENTEDGYTSSGRITSADTYQVIRHNAADSFRVHSGAGSAAVSSSTSDLFISGTVSNIAGQPKRIFAKSVMINGDSVDTTEMSGVCTVPDVVSGRLEFLSLRIPSAFISGSKLVLYAG